MNINNIENIKEYGIKGKVPITKDDTLSFLLEYVKKIQAKQILEIGTAIGYSAIVIASECDIDHLDSVEIDVSRYNIAKKNVHDTNLENIISLHLIDAMQFITNCDKKYDFIYLDGPKGQYINYLPHLIKLLNKGGVIFADNLHFHGMVTGEIPVSKGCRSMIKGLKNYINAIKTNESLNSEIYDIGDGVGVSVKI